MTQANFEDAIQFFVCRQPFRPFVVELVNGRRYPINHAKDLKLRHGISYYTPHGEAGQVCLFDHQSVCLVCDVEDRPNLLIDEDLPIIEPDFLDLDQ